MKRVFIQHFEHIRHRLQNYFEHTGMGLHPDVLGGAREGFVKLFLKQNLPSLIGFSTGEIIDCNDKRSGQVDIIIQSLLSPRIQLFEDIQISLVDSCIAAIEVKSNLTTANIESDSHLKSALNLVRRIKNLERLYLIKGTVNFSGSTPTEVLIEKTPCFIFAYQGPTKETLVEKINEYKEFFKIESLDDFCPEVITVIDKGYTLIKNDGWLMDPAKNTGSYYWSNEQEDGGLVEFFTYLVNLIENRNSQYQPTNFTKYYRDT